jgi:hypothetical protein
MESYNIIISAVKTALRSGEKKETAISERAHDAADDLLPLNAPSFG